MLKISTICSAFNSINKIDLLINSFQSQKYSNKELVIVDGSLKNIQFKILSKKFNKYKNIKVYHLKGASIYKCLNFGIKKSTGQILNIMGDDDIYFNNKIFGIISQYFKKKIDFIYGNTIYKKNNNFVRYYKSFNLKKNLVNIGYMPSHTALFINKNISNKIGNYNETYLIMII